MNYYEWILLAVCVLFVALPLLSNQNDKRD